MLSTKPRKTAPPSRTDLETRIQKSTTQKTSVFPRLTTTVRIVWIESYSSADKSKMQESLLVLELMLSSPCASCGAELPTFSDSLKSFYDDANNAGLEQSCFFNSRPALFNNMTQLLLKVLKSKSNFTCWGFNSYLIAWKITKRQKKMKKKKNDTKKN